MKHCPACKSSKPLLEFNKDKYATDGHRRYCRACCKLEYTRNRQQYIDRSKRWQADNPEKFAENVRRNSKKRYKADPGMIARTAAAAVERNPGLNRANSAMFLCRKMGRVPPWLTKKQRKEIREWYNLAFELQWLSEEPLQVDHIIPLNSPLVSGLHVPWNLQILPGSLNRKKGNKLD